MPKALISGLGSIGRRHGRNFAALGVTIAGFDPAAERCVEFEKEIPGAQTFTDFDEALGVGCDFAVIASPNAFHVEQALACAKRDINMLIEKPLATESDGLDALQEQIDARGLQVHIGSNWKFHPSVRLMHDLIADGRIGQILAVQAIGGQYLPDWHPWEDYRQMYSSRRELGGGVLHDCHDLDYLTWMLGAVESVSSRIVNTGTLEIDTPDLANIILQFENGCLGTVQIDYLQRPNARRVHVTGTTGTLIWDFIKGVVEHYVAADKSWYSHRVADDYDINEMYVEQARHYLDCIQGGASVMTPMAQACHVVDVMACCKTSSADGGRLVKVQNG